jgi:hypothetical protein
METNHLDLEKHRRKTFYRAEGCNTKYELTCYKYLYCLNYYFP